MPRVKWVDMFAEPRQRVDMFAEPRQQMDEVQVIAAGNGGRAWFVDVNAEKPLVLNPEWKKGVDLYNLILENIQEVYDVNGLIAGGAVRDYFMGIDTHKDIDVFLPMTFKQFKERVGELGWELRKEIAPYEHNECNFERGTTYAQGQKIDLVFCTKGIPDNLEEAFPINTTRGRFTLGDEFKVSDEMMHDLENKTFTLNPKVVTNKELRDKYVEKIRNSWMKRPHFKDWTISTKGIHDWWEDPAAYKEDPVKQGKAARAKQVRYYVQRMAR